MLPKFQSQDPALSLLQTQWASQLDPVLNAPIVNSVLLKSIALRSGSNTINHTLGRVLQGWVVVRSRASATFYDTQDANTIPSKTLVLVASAPVTVDLMVF